MARASRPADNDKQSSGRIVGKVLWTSIKIMIIPVLCIAALIVGLAVGYVILGDKPLSDVFDVSTWKHMYDLVFAAGG